MDSPLHSWALGAKVLTLRWSPQPGLPEQENGERQRIKKHPPPMQEAYLPQQIDGEDDLERSRPNHIDVGRQVHEPLRVHRHQVDDFPHGGHLSC